ncbi:MAG: hypothetical protein WKG32_15670 [Gemmatimonadaceae bacterium]
MRTLAAVPVVLTLLAAAPSAGPAVASSAGVIGDDVTCWECDDYEFNLHYDGGYFMTVEGKPHGGERAVSGTCWNSHTPVTYTCVGFAKLLGTGGLNRLARAIEAEDVDAVRSMLLEGRVAYNAERQAVQVIGCDGVIRANLLVSDEMNLALVDARGE